MTTLETVLDEMLAQALVEEPEQDPGPEMSSRPTSLGTSGGWRPRRVDLNTGQWDRRGRRYEVFVVPDTSRGTPGLRVESLGGRELTVRELIRTHALREALAGLGVAPEIASALTQASLACASANTATGGTNTPDATVREQPCDDDTEAGAAKLVERGQALVGVVETLSRSVAHLEGVVLASVSELTGLTGATLLADKGVADSTLR